MSLLEAIFLGILQGATEFLPISSSGHLVVIPALFDLSEPTLGVIAIAHLGSLLAVFIYFRDDISQIVQAVFRGLLDRRPLATVEARLGWFIVVGTIPAGAAGLLFEEPIDAFFVRDPRWAAGFLIGTAGLLVLGERLLSGEKTLARMTWFDAIVIGVFQMLALLPGISRSGSTIVGGLLRGLDRPTAARYGFLLGIPAIFAAGLLSVADLIQAPDALAQLPALTATFVAAAVVGYACIYLLLQWVKQRRLYPFAAYCVALSLLFFIVSG